MNSQNWYDIGIASTVTMSYIMLCEHLNIRGIKEDKKHTKLQLQQIYADLKSVLDARGSLEDLQEVITKKNINLGDSLVRRIAAFKNKVQLYPC